jgi:Xaa-Pro aminopeptidase
MKTILSLAILSFAAQTFAAEVVPPADLPASVYQARRDQLMNDLGGCAAVIAAQGHHGGEFTGGFRQDGDFYWLTGLNEEGAWLEFSPKARTVKVRLWLKPRDPEEERWTGPREGISPALLEKWGVDKVSRGQPELVRSAALSGCVAIIAPLGKAKDERPDVKLSREAASAAGVKVEYKRTVLERLREAHPPEEIARIDRAIALTRFGHQAAARSTVAGVDEKHVQAEMEHAFYLNGATGLSYGSIVGSGENGAVLHWGRNDRLLRDGDLVVIDAAAEYGRYAADITRTYPVSGKFSDEQAKVYRAVYQAQEDIMAAIHPGVSMPELQKAAEDSLRRSGYLDKFIHGFGHFVGLDVHDAGDYEAPLPVGAVITVEPGIYMPERGFGVRIEDMVEITPTGYRLMSSAFPRKLEDVEAWVRDARK